MILKLRTLTPLHIGDGSTLHPFDYAILDGRFYRCSSGFFERFLEEMGGDAAERFVSWSGAIMDEMVELDQSRRLDPRRGRDFNQTMSDLRRRHTLQGFAKDELRNEQAFFEFLKANAPSIPKQPVGKSRKEKQEYRGFQRGADGRAFLPGSSVKGCIRTALLYHFLEVNADRKGEIQEILEKSILEVKRDKQEAAARKFRFNPNRHIKQFGRKIEQLAFFAGMNDHRGKPRPEEAQDDLLRCLLVADTEIPNEQMGMENVDLYLVKKQRTVNGKTDFQGIQQTQAPAVEAILPGQQLDIRIDFNLELLLKLHRQSGDKGITVGRETHFVGWRERAKTLFNISTEDLETIPENTRWDSPILEQLRKKMFDHILDCCRKFSDVQVAALQRWSDNFVKYAMDRYMANDLENGTDAVLSATGTRLHLGFATGFEGMTVVLHLLAHHKKQFADIMDLFGIGDSPSAWKTRRPGQTYLPNPDRFPTSRRLATRPRSIYPLGWLEWTDDPKAGKPKTINQKEVETQAPVIPPTPPADPVYLRGTLKPGAELDAELLEGGNPGKFKLYIRADYHPTVEIKYAAGFKVEDVGRIARLRVKNVSGKLLVVEFVRFK